MLKLIEESSPILHNPSEVVTENEFGTKELEETLDALFVLLKTRKDGVALAAPQAGIAKRIFIIAPELFKNPDSHETVYINPKIVNLSEDKALMEEGCLSVPHVFGKAKRSIAATVEAQRLDGTTFTKTGTGLLAQIFQHETDHLNGVLFNDHASRLHTLTPDEIKRFESEDNVITPMY